jgi:hypothetical protein
MARRCLAVFLLVSSTALVVASGARAQDETLKGMLAVQLRSQGIPCDNPKNAVRDAKRSKPDHDVWVLTCQNATYRVSRYPDLAAKVERLH